MKAWELLSKPGAWTQGSYARASDGVGVGSIDGDACSWCTLGAISRCYPEGDAWSAAIRKLEGKLAEVADTKLVASWNDKDGRTQEEVVALLKELDI